MEHGCSSQQNVKSAGSEEVPNPTGNGRECYATRRTLHRTIDTDELAQAGCANVVDAPEVKDDAPHATVKGLVDERSKRSNVTMGMTARYVEHHVVADRLLLDVHFVHRSPRPDKALGFVSARNTRPMSTLLDAPLLSGFRRRQAG